MRRSDSAAASKEQSIGGRAHYGSKSLKRTTACFLRSNHFEFQAGTNPADPASVFKLVSYNLAPALATLRFRSGTGRNYQFQHSTNLTNWLPVPGHEALPGTGGEIEVSTASAATGFYRVAVKQDC